MLINYVFSTTNTCNGGLPMVVEDLQASTLRLPVTGEEMVNIERLKVEGMNTLISEVAITAAQEKTMLDECEMLLASVAAM
ncbi:hypothetical protein RJT34_12649 [Clitoria ternatea]|uniref:Uncharacterized protein n=1 Tax=Clitoria ternatea TaxID=43366 RepID=A0AAN9PL37_CLITE